MNDPISKSLLIILLVLVIISIGFLGYLYKVNLDLSGEIRRQNSQIDYLENQIQDLNNKVNYLNDMLSKIIGSQKIEIRSIYASSNGNGWTITLKGANTGSMSITILDITLNGRSLSEYSSASATIKMGSTSYIYNNGISARIPENQGFIMTIHLDEGFTSGQTIEVGLVSSLGTIFKRTIVLP